MLNDANLVKPKVRFFVLAFFYQICEMLLLNLKFEVKKSANTTLSLAIGYLEQNYHKQFTIKYIFHSQKKSVVKSR